MILQRINLVHLNTSLNKKDILNGAIDILLPRWLVFGGRFVMQRGIIDLFFLIYTIQDDKKSSAYDKKRLDVINLVFDKCEISGCN